jgi:hypothetical protein
MTAVSNQSRPLVRPSLLKDEWWTGFVGRVIDANGVRPNPNLGMGMFEESVSLLVTPRHVQSHQVGTEGHFGLRMFGRYLLPRQFVRSKFCSVPICHQCFAETNHIPMSWRLRTTSVCLKHNKLLNDQCPQCKLRWNFAVVFRGRCQCGFDLHCTDHQTVAEPQHLVGAATDFDASVFYSPTKYVTECVTSDSNSRRLAFASLWAYALRRVKDGDLNAYAGPRICSLMESQHFGSYSGLGELSIWKFLPKDVLGAELLAKLVSVLRQVKSTSGHAFGLLGVLPINSWICEFEDRIGYLNAPIDLDHPKIKNKLFAQRLLESGLDAFRCQLPAQYVAGSDPLADLGRMLGSLALPKLPLAGSFVSFTSPEMSLDILTKAFPVLWEGIFSGSIWIYTDALSPGFTRFYLDRATYWRWRIDTRAVYHSCNPKQYSRDIFGYANLVELKPRSRSRCNSHGVIRRRKAIESHISQLHLFE